MEQSSVSILEVILASMTGLFILAMGVILIFIIHQRRMIAKDLLQKELENNYQKQLLKATISSQERERNRIAHDLHDEIGALLTISKIYFNQLSPGHGEEQLQQISVKMNVLFDEMMANIRRISHDLRPVLLENLGLLEALESYTEKLAEAGIEFNFTHRVTFSIAYSAEIILYRIMQELISNTLRHAGATSIFIDMAVIQHALRVTYQDNGKGYSPHTGNNGLGMKSIESRLNLLNSKMNLPGGNAGFYFSFMIDIKNLTTND